MVLDFVVKVAETGVVHFYSGLLETETVGLLMEKVKKDTKYELNDQIMLTKKGLKLRIDDKLEIFSNDPLLQSTMKIPDPIYKGKPLYVVFVFNHRYSEYLELRRENSKDNVEQLMPEYKEFNYDYLNSFENENIDINNIEILGKVDVSVVENERLLFSFIQSARKKMEKFKYMYKRADKFLKENDTQLQSFDIIMKYVSQSYQVTKQKKSEAIKKLKEFTDKTPSIIKKI